MLRQFYKLITSNPTFAIEPRTGMSLAAFAMMVLDRKIELSAELFQVEAAHNYSASVSYQGGDVVNNVQVFTVHGTLFMHDVWCGPEGMMTLDNQLQAAIKNPNIHAIVLDISSPGGEAAYTETLGDTVRTSSKPVVAWVNQLAASAAYWIASGADHIMLSGKTAEVGSIGTLISYSDATRYWRERGVDFHVIRSSNSPDKAKFNFSEPSEEDISLIQSEWLNPLTEVFQDVVRTNRQGISDDSLTGNVFMGQEAIDRGLADSFGTLRDAIIKASDLSMEKGNDQRSMSLTEYVHAKTA